MLEKNLSGVVQGVAQASKQLQSSVDASQKLGVSTDEFENILGVETNKALTVKVEAMSLSVIEVVRDGGKSTPIGILAESDEMELSRSVRGLGDSSSVSQADRIGISTEFGPEDRLRDQFDDSTRSIKFDDVEKAKPHSRAKEDAELHLSSKKIANEQSNKSGMTLQEASNALRKEFGASFADQVALRFANLRQAQRATLDTIRDVSNIDALSMNKGIVGSPAQIIQPLAVGSNLKDPARGREIEVPEGGNSVDVDDLKKTVELLFDKKKEMAEISLQLKNHGPIRLRVEVKVDGVYITMMEENPAAYAYLKENIQLLKNQFENSGMRLVEFRDQSEDLKQTERSDTGHREHNSHEDLGTIARA